MMKGIVRRRRMMLAKDLSGRSYGVRYVWPVAFVNLLALDARTLGAYVSLRKKKAATCTNTSNTDVDQKIQRQLVFMDMYAPTIGATVGPRNVRMPYIAWPFPRSSLLQQSASTPLQSFFKVC